MIVKIAKGLVALTIGAVVLFVFIAKFSAVESRYECNGAFKNGDISEPGKIFFKLEVYRPWVGLWSDSDGNMWLEIPNENVDYFDNVRKVADSYQFLESQYSDKVGIRGNFSTLSNALNLKTYMGVFDGYCNQI